MEAQHIGPTITDLFALMNTLIVGAIIFFAAKKPFLASLKDRKENVAKSLAESHQELKNMKVQIQKAQGDLANLERIKKDFVDELSFEGKQTYNKIIAEARAASERILADAQIVANNELREAAEKIKTELVQKLVMKVAASASEKGGELHERMHERLVDKFISDVKLRETHHHDV